MQTIPALAFDMGLSEKDLPSDVNGACNAMIPIAVDEELIERVVYATASSCHGDPVQPEESLLIGFCIKTGSLNVEQGDQGEAHPSSSYVLGDTYKPPNQPLWTQSVRTGDVFVNMWSYSPVTLILRPRRRKHPQLQLIWTRSSQQ